MKIKFLFILILLFLCSYNAEAQCAMCRAVIESEESGEMAKGINNGIIYLMVFSIYSRRRNWLCNLPKPEKKKNQSRVIATSCFLL